MKKKIFIVAAVITSSHLQAQQDSTNKTLDEVIITATKFPQKQSTTGKVITVITKEQIEKSNSRSVSQLLNEQAGITISGALNNSGSNQTVYLRGSSAGRSLILIDGIPVYDPSVNNNYFDLNLISLNNVESIEVCRGAQSTLYGSDAVAGVINIITLKTRQSSAPSNAANFLQRILTVGLMPRLYR
jgi:vitamin B12 transporter